MKRAPCQLNFCHHFVITGFRVKWILLLQENRESKVRLFAMYKYDILIVLKMYKLVSFNAGKATYNQGEDADISAFVRVNSNNRQKRENRKLDFQLRNWGKISACFMLGLDGILST